MFKLLTEEERLKVLSEYKMRRAVVMIGALMGVFIIGIVGLLPSYVLSIAEQREVKLRAGVSEDPNFQSGTTEIREWLAKTNVKLQVLNPNLDKERPSTLAESILKEKGSGIRITGLSGVRTEESISISVSGVAQTRQALLSFEDRLNDSGKFSSVALPVSNLAKDKDIVFQIKLTPKKP